MVSIEVIEEVTEKDKGNGAKLPFPANEEQWPEVDQQKDAKNESVKEDDAIARVTEIDPAISGQVSSELI